MAQPPAGQLQYNHGMVPEPVLLHTGETLYPGETTTITHENVFYLPATDSTVAPATGDFLMPGSSTGNTAGSPPVSAATLTHDDGSFLDRYADGGRIWVEDNRLPQRWCWEDDRPDFQPAAIGITPAAAAAEIAVDLAETKQ